MIKFYWGRNGRIDRYESDKEIFVHYIPHITLSLKPAFGLCELFPLKLAALYAFGMDFWASLASTLRASSAAWRASVSPTCLAEPRQDRTWQNHLSLDFFASILM
jgi:hypothetical protein